jgi:hypothetical protein
MVVPQTLTRIEPVLVVAPTRRCGTTLVQRLLNSSRNTIIYGENFGFTESLPGIIGSYMSRWDAKKHNADATMRQFLNGDRTLEASTLFPELGGYVKVLASGFYGALAHYDQYSRELGFTSWGIKNQIRVVGDFLHFVNLVPRARMLFIYRDLWDVAKSEKARFARDYPQPAAYRRLGAAWMNNLRAIQSLKLPNLLLLRYEELLANPGEFLPRIEAFTKVAGIDCSVLQKKVNVNPMIDRLTTEELASSYRPPAQLTDAESEALFADCADYYRQMGYGLGTPNTPRSPSCPATA